MLGECTFSQAGCVGRFAAAGLMQINAAVGLGNDTSFGARTAMIALKVIRFTALAALIFASAPTRADNECERPTNQWRSRGAVEQLAERKGWQIDHVKVDDGCYEIKGRDVDGNRFKAKLDPATLDIVSMKRKHGREGDRSQAKNEPTPGEHE
jgi:hypothetical protein